MKNQDRVRGAAASVRALATRAVGALLGRGSGFEFNVLITTSATLAVMAAGVLTSILLSRLLGPEGRGAIAAVMLWPSLLMYLANLGVISASVYYSSLPDSRPGAVFANGLVFAAAQSAVAITLGYFALPYLLARQDASVLSTARFYLLLIPIGLVGLYSLSILQGMRLFGRYNRLRAIVPVGYLLGTIALAAVGYLSFRSVVLLNLALTLVNLVATLYCLAASGVGLGLRFDPALAKQMLRYGVKVQVGDVSVLGNYRLDQVFLAAWFSPAELGLYVAAVAAASPAEILATSVKTVVTSELTQLTTAGERDVMLERVLRRYWSRSLPLAVCLALALPVLIPLFFGTDFRPAILPAEVLVLAMVFSGAKEVLTGVARALGRPSISSRAEVVGLAVTVVSLAVMLPVMGMMGAAVASLLSYGMTLLVITVGLVRSEKLRLRCLFPFFAG